MTTPQRSPRTVSEPAPTTPTPRLLLGVLLTALVLRVLQVASAARSPITFNPGADESYYLQFGEWVAAHGLAVPTTFAFMDPAYGYLVGAVFAAAGPAVLAVYLLQAILDVVTAWLLYRCGVALGSTRGGLVAAAIYAFYGTAILFTTTALKATLVAFCAAGWTLLALRALQRPTAMRWIALGLAGGLVVGVRGNLLLWSIGALASLPWLAPRMSVRRRVVDAGTLALGLAVGLSVWSLRHAQLDLGWSPLPFNGGIVLHHTYNPSNPRALMQLPEWVNYRHPVEIWRGYAREAERIHGRPMSPREISSYWQREALEYLTANPAGLAINVSRKLRELVAAPEIPNNRIYTQERALSPVLSALPAPFPWVLALGLAGLAVLLVRDRRAWAVLIPLATCVATALVFFPEDRFRFHGVPTLIIGAGMVVDRLIAWTNARSWIPVAVAGTAIAVIAALSLALGRGVHYPTREIEREAWGYLRMGDAARAEALAREALASGDDNARVHELLGFLASRRSDHAEAVRHFGAAVALRPNAAGSWFSLAENLDKSGDTQAALASIDAALGREPLADYALFKGRILERLGDQASAIDAYRQAADAGPEPESADAADAATARLRALCGDQPVVSCSRRNEPTP